MNRNFDDNKELDPQTLKKIDQLVMELTNNYVSPDPEDIPDQDSFEQYFKILENKNLDVKTRRRAALWLSTHPRLRDVERILEYLQDDDKKIRQLASLYTARIRTTYPQTFTQITGSKNIENPPNNSGQSNSLLLTFIVAVITILSVIIYLQNTDKIASTLIENLVLPSFPTHPQNQPFISRKANNHTHFIYRTDFEDYQVNEADNVYSIADKFEISPYTLLQTNLYSLQDDVHNLDTVNTIAIPPSNNNVSYHKWKYGDTPDQIAKLYNTVPSNLFTLDGEIMRELTDYPGSWIVVTDGIRRFSPKTVPRITKNNGSVGISLNPNGSCSIPRANLIISGKWEYPTTSKQVGNYLYAPAINHYGVDFRGSINDKIMAIEGGVVVFAGETQLHFGNLVIIDHGNGWQSSYSHLGKIITTCGAFVSKGDTIAEFADSYFHLETLNDSLGLTDPLTLLNAN